MTKKLFDITTDHTLGDDVERAAINYRKWRHDRGSDEDVDDCSMRKGEEADGNELMRRRLR